MEAKTGSVTLEERQGAVTLKNKPVTLIGPPIQVGQRAPDFTLVDPEGKEVTLSTSKGKVRLFSVVFSLETPVCNLQTTTFEDLAVKYPNAVFYTISMDLPMAQARYVQDHQVQHMRFLSDYRDASFGRAYGLLIKENRLLARAVIIVDADDIVRYVQVVKEVTYGPDHEEAEKALDNIYHECFDAD